MDTLVVIGNGMAGARTVEEILARDGAQRFQVTMFGDEPYGNYNRILLSEVLVGAEGAREIFLNPLDWYEENGITLHAGVRVVEVDRWAKQVSADDGTVTGYDKLLIATGSRPFVPPIRGLADGGWGLRSGVAACLDARMQASVDAYRDPWQAEAAAPKTTGQLSRAIGVGPT